MDVRQHFDVKRFWALLKLQSAYMKKPLTMTLVVAFGMLFFVDLLLSGALETHKLVHEFGDSYAYVLIIGGCVLSSLAFSGLGRDIRRVQFLMLPVSAFERLLCAWLLTSVVWVAVFTVAYTLFSLAIVPFGQLVFKALAFGKFSPMGEQTLIMIRYCLILQGVFLLGASQFRGYAFAKTLLVLVLLAAVCGLAFYYILEDVLLTEHECDGTDCEIIEGISATGFWAVCKWLFWWALAPFALLMTYLGLKEQEA